MGGSARPASARPARRAQRNDDVASSRPLTRPPKHLGARSSTLLETSGDCIIRMPAAPDMARAAEAAGRRSAELHARKMLRQECHGGSRALAARRVWAIVRHGESVESCFGGCTARRLVACHCANARAPPGSLRGVEMMVECRTAWTTAWCILVVVVGAYGRSFAALQSCCCVAGCVRGAHVHVWWVGAARRGGGPAAWALPPAQQTMLIYGASPRGIP